MSKKQNLLSIDDVAEKIGALVGGVSAEIFKR